MVFVNHWLESLINGAQAWPQGMWIYALIIVLVMLEGPVTILLAAGFSTSGYLQPLLVFCSAALGNLIADFLWYNLGYFGRMDWLERLPKFLRINTQKIARLKRVVNQHAVKLIIFGKMANGVMIPVLVATGMACVPLRKWFPVVFISNLVVSAAYVFVGYHLTSNLVKVQHGIRYFTIFAALVFILAVWIYIKRLLTSQDLITEMEAEKDV